MYVPTIKSARFNYKLNTKQYMLQLQIYKNLDRRALHSVLMQSFLVQFPGKLLREVRGLHMFNGICSQQFPIELCLSNQLVLRSLWKLSACIKLTMINK